MATTKKETTVIKMPQLKLANIKIKIVGDTPLICHAWSQKSKVSIVNGMTQKATTGKEPIRPAVDFANSLYWLTEKPDFDGLTDEEVQKILIEVIPKSKFGFPTLAFKSAAIDGAFQQGLLAQRAGGNQLAKTTARGAIRTLETFAEIHGMPEFREDMIRLKGSSATPRYRAEFKTWWTELPIQYHANAISAEQIATLFNVGGFASGVGEWRPEKNGTFGTFHVA